jgi:mannitol-1-phosphate/altronate dehydrogenase
VVRDLEPDAVPRTAFGLVIEALRRRRSRGLAPFTVMSCDNLQDNGRLSRRVFTTFARLRDPDLGDWVEHEVRFPDSMVGRITPGDHRCRPGRDPGAVRHRRPVAGGLRAVYPVGSPGCLHRRLRQREDPDAFIANRDVFGDLADDERFVAAYRSALASLRQRGARATMRSLV